MDLDYLIIYAHPNPKSFNCAIKETVEKKLKTNGKTFEIRDLYELKFEPVMKADDFIAIQQGTYLPDVKKEQELISKAKRLVVIHPIWWYSMPAILKGYIDRVFSYGFAYILEDELKPLLTDKEIVIINTMGESKEQASAGGFDKCLRKTIGGIFEFCGIKVLEHKFFYSVPYVEDKDRKNMLKEVENLMDKII